MEDGARTSSSRSNAGDHATCGSFVCDLRGPVRENPWLCARARGRCSAVGRSAVIEQLSEGERRYRREEPRLPEILSRGLTVQFPNEHHDARKVQRPAAVWAWPPFETGGRSSLLRPCASRPPTRTSSPSCWTASARTASNGARSAGSRRRTSLGPSGSRTSTSRRTPTSLRRSSTPSPSPLGSKPATLSA